MKELLRKRVEQYALNAAATSALSPSVYRLYIYIFIVCMALNEIFSMFSFGQVTVLCIFCNLQL